MSNVAFTYTLDNKAEDNILFTPMMAVEYTDRLNDGVFTADQNHTRIGDTIIGGTFTDGSATVVEQVYLAENFHSRSVASMRSSSTTKTHASASNRTFQILMTFSGLYALFGNSRPVTYSSYGSIHNNSLAALLAQFKRTPIVPIEDKFITYEHGVSAVALTGIEIYTNRSYPGCIKVQLTVSEVDYGQYCPSATSYMDSIIWPLYRYHWSNHYRYLSPGQVPIPTIADDTVIMQDYSLITGDLNGILEFFVADEEYLNSRLDDVISSNSTPEETKRDTSLESDHKSHTPLKKLAACQVPYNKYLSVYGTFATAEQDFATINLKNTVTTTVMVKMTNNFVFQSAESATGFSAQFMGHGDTTVSLILTTYGESSHFTQLYDDVREMMSKYKAILYNSPLIIANEIVNLAGVRAVVPVSRACNTVPGMPGMEQVAIEFAEFDINQKHKMLAKRLYSSNGTQFEDYISELDGYRLSDASKAFYKEWGAYLKELSNSKSLFSKERGHNIDGAVLRSQIHPWYGKIYTEVALEALEQAEVYPDLQLPTYLRLMDDIQRGLVCDDDKIKSSLKQHLEILDQLWYGSGRFVDPDFYIDYPRVTSADSPDSMQELFDMFNNTDKVTKELQDLKAAALEQAEKDIAQIKKEQLKKIGEYFRDGKDIYGAIEEDASILSGNIAWLGARTGKDQTYHRIHQPYIWLYAGHILYRNGRFSKENLAAYYDYLVKNDLSNANNAGEQILKNMNARGKQLVDAYRNYFGQGNKTPASVISFYNETGYTGPYDKHALLYGVMKPDPKAPLASFNEEEYKEIQVGKKLSGKINKYIQKYANYGIIIGTTGAAIFQSANIHKDTVIDVYGSAFLESDKDEYTSDKDTKNAAGNTLLKKIASITGGSVSSVMRYAGILISSDSGGQIDISGYRDIINELRNNEIYVIDRNGSSEIQGYIASFRMIESPVQDPESSLEYSNALTRKQYQALVKDTAKKNSVGRYKVLVDSKLESNGKHYSPAVITKIVAQMNDDFSAGWSSDKFLENSQNEYNKLKVLWESKNISTATSSIKKSLKELYEEGLANPANEQAVKNILDRYCAIRLLTQEMSALHGGGKNVLGSSLSDAVGKIDATYSATQIEDIYSAPQSINVRAFDMLQDEIASPNGRMLQAFPAYTIQVIEEGPNIVWRKFLPIFWTMGNLSHIQVIMSDRNPTHLCRLVMDDSYRNYVNRGVMEEMRDNMPQIFRMKSWTGGVSNILENIKSIYTSTVYLSGFMDASSISLGLSEHESNMIIERMRAYAGMFLKQDHRIHVRMGYGSNGRLLDVIFNGTIVQVSDGPIVEILAEGDGIELVNKINKNFKNNDVVDASASLPEPRETILALMNAHHESYFYNGIGDLWGKAWHQMVFIKSGGNFYSDRGLGIVHFGCPIMHRLNTANILYGQSGMSMDKAMQNIFFPTDYNKGSKKKQESIAYSMAVGAGSIIGGLIGSSAGPIGTAGGALVGASATKALWNTIFYNRKQGTFGFGSPGETGENIYSSFSAVERFDYDFFKHQLSEGSASLTGYVPNTPDITKWNERKLLGFLHWPKYRFGLNFKVKDKSPWDIIETYANGFPPYIATVRPFEYRSTLFFGAPYYTYRFDYNRVHSSSYSENMSGSIPEPPTLSGTSRGPVIGDTMTQYDAIAKAYDAARQEWFELSKTIQWWPAIGITTPSYSYPDGLEYPTYDSTLSTNEREVCNTRIKSLLIKYLGYDQNIMSNKRYKAKRCDIFQAIMNKNLIIAAKELKVAEFSITQMNSISRYCSKHPRRTGVGMALTINRIIFSGGIKQYPNLYVKYTDPRHKPVGEDETSNEALMATYNKIKMIGLPMAYLCKPLNQCFIHTSYDNILDNGLVCDSDNMYTDVTVRWFANAKKGARTESTKVFLDKNIYPQLRRSYFIDADVVGFGGINWAISVAFTPLYAVLGGAKNLFAPLAGKRSAEPDKIGEFTVKHRMKFYARSILRDSVRDMYSGIMVVKGNPKIMPYCQAVLVDDTRALSGMVDVGTTSHIMSVSDGYITTYEPKLKAYVKGDKYNEYIHGLLWDIVSTAGSLYLTRLNTSSIYRKYNTQINLMAGKIVYAIGNKYIKSRLMKYIGKPVIKQVSKGLVYAGRKVIAKVATTKEFANTTKILKALAKHHVVTKKNVVTAITSTHNKGLMKKLAGKVIMSCSDDIAAGVVRTGAKTTTEISHVAVKAMGDKMVSSFSSSGITKSLGTKLSGLVGVWNTLLWVAVEILTNWLFYWYEEWLDSYYSLSIMPLRRKGQLYLSGMSGYRENMMMIPRGAIGGMARRITKGATYWSSITGSVSKISGIISEFLGQSTTVQSHMNTYIRDIMQLTTQPISTTTPSNNWTGSSGSGIGMQSPSWGGQGIGIPNDISYDNTTNPAYNPMQNQHLPGGEPPSGAQY